jgi:hypothetical protein
MMKVYNGVFNWHGIIYDIYAECVDEEQAFRTMCKEIADSMKLSNDIDVRHYFWGTTYFTLKEVNKDGSDKKKKGNGEIKKCAN